MGSRNTHMASRSSGVRRVFSFSRPWQKKRAPAVAGARGSDSSGCYALARTGMNPGFTASATSGNRALANIP